jgi:hypothetical protein
MVFASWGSATEGANCYLTRFVPVIKTPGREFRFNKFQNAASFYSRTRISVFTARFPSVLDRNNSGNRLKEHSPLTKSSA